MRALGPALGIPTATNGEQEFRSILEAHERAGDPRSLIVEGRGASAKKERLDKEQKERERQIAEDRARLEKQQRDDWERMERERIAAEERRAAAEQEEKVSWTHESLLRLERV